MYADFFFLAVLFFLVSLHFQIMEDETVCYKSGSRFVSWLFCKG